MIIKQLKEDETLNEIQQQIPIRLAFATVCGDEVTRIHEFVKCRDFLGDVVWATANQKSMDIYGFTIDPSKQIIDKEVTTLLLEINKEDVYKRFQKQLSIITDIEQKNGLPLTECTVV